MMAIIPVEVVAVAPTAIEQGWAQPPTMCPISVHCMIPCKDSLAKAAFHNQPVQRSTLHCSSIRLCGLLVVHRDSARHNEL
jgi:hypothetical protein